MNTAAAQDWGYGLLLLASVSGFFIMLRLFERAFVALEFELVVIHMPVVISLMVYMAMRRLASLRPRGQRL